MGTFLKILLVLALTFGTVGALAAIYSEPVPTLKEGDLIFRTNLNAQAAAIMGASDSKYTSVGVIKYTPQGLAVIETTPQGHKAILIEKWIDQGFWNRYAVYRYRNLETARQIRIINSLYKYRDRGYDYYFSFNNKELYGSELVYLAYREAGVDIGKPQKIRFLNLDNPFTRNLLQKRLPFDPECKGKTKEECYKIIINRDVITPANLADDLNMELIYSNYPF